jgi:hypothetical protein
MNHNIYKVNNWNYLPILVSYLSSFHRFAKSFKLFMYTNWRVLPCWIVFGFSKHRNIATRICKTHADKNEISIQHSITKKWR